MSDAKRTVTGLAGRYATALFDLAKEAKVIDIVAESLSKLMSALATMPDVASLTTSPMISRAAGAKGIAAVAAALELDPLTDRFLGVLAANRRMGSLKAISSAFGLLLSHHKGETAAEVTSAHALTDSQLAALKAKLRAGLGVDVTLTTHIDPAILGGLVVKVGSKLIDSSLKTKLDSLALAMTKAA